MVPGCTTNINTNTETSTQDRASEQTETNEINDTGVITVRITDNLLSCAAFVQCYQDDVEMWTPLKYVSEEGRSFNLEYNHYYRFEILPPEGSNWTTWSYDACPQQDGYDDDVGDVYLDAENNHIVYIIAGNDANTEGSGFDTPSFPETIISFFKNTFT
jgi:hypothetical protein